MTAVESVVEAIAIRPGDLLISPKGEESIVVTKVYGSRKRRGVFADPTLQPVYPVVVVEGTVLHWGDARRYSYEPDYQVLVARGGNW